MSPASNAKPRFGRLEIIGTIVVLALAAVCGKLCLWQVHRLRERRLMNAGIAARLDAPPIAGYRGVTDTAGALYRRIRIRGLLDRDRSIILPGRSYQGAPGVHVLTPAVIGDGAAAVLINRGWVPSADGATIELARLDTTSPGDMVGLMLPFPTRAASTSSTGDSIPDPGEFKRVWYTIDEAALRSQFPYPLAPFLVQLLPDTGASGFPRRLAPPSLDEGPHLSYAIQWFCFAVILIVGWFTFLSRRRADMSGPVMHAPPHPPAY